MIRSYRNEVWKPIVFDAKISENELFQISNFGRILNCKGEKPFLIKGSNNNGYTGFSVRQKENNRLTTRYVHKLLAQHFLEKKEGQIYVIHLNYDKKDNSLENLQWATKREKEIHQFTNPDYINQPPRINSAKLTETKVMLLKRKLNDPNRRTRLKILAKQFGVSEMQLHRIKTGENWGHIKEY